MLALRFDRLDTFSWRGFSGTEMDEEHWLRSRSTGVGDGEVNGARSASGTRREALWDAYADAFMLKNVSYTEACIGKSVNRLARIQDLYAVKWLVSALPIQQCNNRRGTWNEKLSVHQQE